MGNISLVRVGGVCAVLAVVSGIMARIFFGNAWLASRGVDTLVTGHWFDLLFGLFGLPAALGIYHFMHKAAGTAVLIAVTAFVIGITFLLFHEFVWFGIRYELVPDTFGLGWLAVGVGGVLIVFVGVPLFSFVILRTAMVPNWIGWLGMIAVVANVALVAVLSGVFESISPPWYIALGTLMAWMLAMGVVMLRLKEPAPPDSVGVSS